MPAVMTQTGSYRLSLHLDNSSGRLRGTFSHATSAVASLHSSSFPVLSREGRLPKAPQGLALSQPLSTPATFPGLFSPLALPCVTGRRLLPPLTLHTTPGTPEKHSFPHNPCHAQFMTPKPRFPDAQSILAPHMFTTSSPLAYYLFLQDTKFLSAADPSPKPRSHSCVCLSPRLHS